MNSREGRFLSQDPLGIGGGDANPYAYVNNDPVSATDRLGLFSAGAGGGGGGGGGDLDIIGQYLHQHSPPNDAPTGAGGGGGGNGSGGGGEDGGPAGCGADCFTVGGVQFAPVNLNLEKTGLFEGLSGGAFSSDQSLSLGNTVVRYTGGQYVISTLLGSSIGAGVSLNCGNPRVGQPIGTIDVGLGSNLGASVGLARSFSSGKVVVSSVGVNVGPSVGLPIGFESPGVPLF